jgi:Ca-activated chloride channel family protein
MLRSQCDTFAKLMLAAQCAKVRWRPEGLTLAVTCAVLACGHPAGVARAQESGPRVSIEPRARRQAEPKESRPNAIRVDVSHVLVPVTVTDALGRPVQGLRKENFRVSENGVKQEVLELFRDDTPVSIGVVLDASRSMRTRIAPSRQAVLRFLQTTPPADEFFLVTFQDRPELVQGFTKNVHDIERGLHPIQPDGWTALYDAMYLGIHQLKRAAYQRKVLLILSDGADNNSRYTERQMKSLVRESDVRIMVIFIQTHSPSLERLAEETGGRGFRVRNLQELPELADTVSAEVHEQYMLAYAPANPERNGKYRRVTVELVQPAGSPPQRISWRQGYYSPSQ